MPSRPPARRPAGQRLERDRLRGGEVQHVDRAAPHTSPSTSSPPNGSRVQVSGVHGHDVGVAHQAEGRGRRVGALDAGHRGWCGPARAPARTPRGRGRCPRDSCCSVSLLRTSWPDSDGAVVHAPVADHLLQELRRSGGYSASVHGSLSQLRFGGPQGSSGRGPCSTPRSGAERCSTMAEMLFRYPPWRGCRRR